MGTGAVLAQAEADFATAKEEAWEKAKALGDSRSAEHMEAQSAAGAAAVAQQAAAAKQAAAEKELENARTALQTDVEVRCRKR